jgi:hypothetical protein
MDDFSYLVYIPSLKSKKRFLQLNNRTYKTIVKFIQNNDDIQLCIYLKTIIKKLCVDNINVSNLTNLDLLCVLLAIRVICIGSSLELLFDGQQKKPLSLKFDLSNILHRVSNIEYDTSIVKVDSIAVTVDLPRQLIINDTTDFISKIKIDGNTYNVNTYSSKDWEKIRNNLPVSILHKVSNKISNISSSKIIVSQKTENTPHIVIDITSNTVFDFVKLIYNSSLHSFYTHNYILSSKLNLTPQYIEDIIPIEIDIYINKYKEEIEASKKAMESSKGQFSNMEGMISPEANDEVESIEDPESVIPGGFKF